MRSNDQKSTFNCLNFNCPNLELLILYFIRFHILQVKGRDVGFQTTKEGEFWRILLPGIYSMEVFAEGFQPREVQFAIVEQNPTLLNITLFKENNGPQLQLTNDLTGAGTDEIEDKLDLEEGDLEETDEEEDDKIFGFIPNPLAKIQKDIQSNVDSFLAKIPIIG